MGMGSGGAAAKPTEVQKAATAAQTSLLQQEQDRINNLEAALSYASINAQRQLGITSTGNTLDQLVGRILGSGQSGQEFAQNYQAPLPAAPPAPQPTLSFDEWLNKNGYGNLQPIGKPGKSGYKDVSTQKTELFNAYYKPYALQQERATRDYEDYVRQYGTPGSSVDRTGQSRTGYEAGTLADLMKQISATASATGKGEFDQSLSDRLRAALTPNADEETAKKALIDRVLSLTTGQGASTFQDLLDRVSRGASGDQPIDPAVQRELDRQEATMGNALRKQLGTGYQTSTAGAMRLGDFAQARAAAVAKDQREGLQSAIQALVGYGEAPTAPINQRIALEAQGTARVQDALGQLTNYQTNQQNNLSQLINNLTGYENSILGRQSNTAQQYLQLQALPYQDQGLSQIAQLYGQQAAAQQPYASQPGVSPGYATASTAIGGLGALGGLFAGVGSLLK